MSGMTGIGRLQETIERIDRAHSSRAASLHNEEHGDVPRAVQRDAEPARPGVGQRWS
jgi:hypothetical protein